MRQSAKASDNRSMFSHNLTDLVGKCKVFSQRLGNRSCEIKYGKNRREIKYIVAFLYDSNSRRSSFNYETRESVRTGCPTVP